MFLSSPQLSTIPGLCLGSPSLRGILESPPGSELGNCSAHLTYYYSPSPNSSGLSVIQRQKTAVSQFSFYIDAVRPIFLKYKDNCIII